MEEENKKYTEDQKEWNEKVNEILAFDFIIGDENIKKFDLAIKKIKRYLYGFQELSWKVDKDDTIKKIGNLVMSFGTIKLSHVFIMDRMAAFELFIYLEPLKLRSYFYFSNNFKTTWRQILPTLKLDDVAEEIVQLWREIVSSVDKEGIKKYLIMMQRDTKDNSTYNKWLFDYLNKK